MCKIGKSDDVSKRVSQIQTSCPYKLHLLYQGEYPQTFVHIIEKSLHYLLSPYSTSANNEWFELRESALLELPTLLSSFSKIYPSSAMGVPILWEKQSGGNIQEECENKGNDFILREPYNNKRRRWYRWKKRAEAVGIPMLSRHRPTKVEREFWEASIVAAEDNMKICLPNKKTEDKCHQLKLL